MRISKLLPFPDLPPEGLRPNSTTNRASYYHFFTKYFNRSFLETLPLLEKTADDGDDFLNRRLDVRYCNGIEAMMIVQLKEATIALLDDYANSFWILHPNRHHRDQARRLIAELRSTNFSSVSALKELIQTKVQIFSPPSTMQKGSYWRRLCFIVSACEVAFSCVNPLTVMPPPSPPPSEGPRFIFSSEVMNVAEAVANKKTARAYVETAHAEETALHAAHVKRAGIDAVAIADTTRVSRIADAVERVKTRVTLACKKATQSDLSVKTLKPNAGAPAARTEAEEAKVATRAATAAALAAAEEATGLLAEADAAILAAQDASDNRVRNLRTAVEAATPEAERTDAYATAFTAAVERAERAVARAEQVAVQVEEAAERAKRNCLVVFNMVFSGSTTPEPSRGSEASSSGPAADAPGSIPRPS